MILYDLGIHRIFFFVGPPRNIRQNSSQISNVEKEKRKYSGSSNLVLAPNLVEADFEIQNDRHMREEIEIGLLTKLTVKSCSSARTWASPIQI